MRPQRTLRTAVEFSGVGLHSGETIHARILPAPPGTGIEFLRTDVADAPPIPANVSYHTAKERRTRLQRGNAQVDTVEHLLAACSGLEIDNLVVELSGPELSGMDGSALPFVELLREAGIAEQRSVARVFRLDEPIYVRDRDATLVALPSDGPGLTLQYVASFDEPGVGGGSITVRVDPDSFVREIAPARTFCLASEVDALRAAGLGKGATRENTVVLGDPATELRIDAEPVRHKLLDLLGDLSLVGVPLKAQILAARPGHASNVEFARMIRKLYLEKRLVKKYQHERKKGVVFDINAITELLPHRYPFLLVDKIISLEIDKKIVGIKNVTMNEPFFVGHFPGQPVMPGVLMIEAMAQCGGILMLNTLENPKEKLAFFSTIDKAKFRRPVVPGDQVVMEVEMTNKRRNIIQMRGKAFVEGDLVAEAEMMAAVVDKLQAKKNGE